VLHIENVLHPGVDSGVGWRRCAVDFEDQQRHVVVSSLLNEQPV